MQKKVKKIPAERVVVENFSKLKKDMFDGLYNGSFADMQGEMLLISKDGCLYINEKSESADLLKKVWDVLLPEDMFTLASLRRMMLDKYPDAKIETLHEMKVSEEEKMKVFAALLVPVELNRRGIEKKYYGI